MKKLFSLMAMAILVVSVLPMVFANDTGTGIGIDIPVEDFTPRLWMCDNRAVIDDELEPGRVDGNEVYSEKIETCELVVEGCMTYCEQGQLAFSFDLDGSTYSFDFDETWDLPLECQTACVEFTKKWSCDILKGFELVERSQNYAFEGEKIEWLVLAMDKNKIEDIVDVVATLGDLQAEPDFMNDAEVECVRLNGFAAPGSQILPECNARILEEEIDQFDDQTMAYYECTLTVETPLSMYGEYFISVEAEDSNGNTVSMDENEYWFLNPVIALSVDGDVEFTGSDGITGVRPGTVAYSDTILIGNDADPSSGVMLDMFISGTDFYDGGLGGSGARCVITNRLKLGNNNVASGDESAGNVCDIGFGDTDDHLCYYATNGAYGTQTDPRSDSEGYAPIVYGDSFTEDFYDDAEIIWDGRSPALGPYSPGNVLAPGADIALTFKLGLPEPCVGDFTDGDIYFWGEAI